MKVAVAEKLLVRRLPPSYDRACGNFLNLDAGDVITMTAARVAFVSFVTALIAAWTVRGLRAGSTDDPQVSKPAQTAPGPPAHIGATKTLTGTVFESKGKQVREGRVWLPVKWLNPWESLTAAASFNGLDSFQLTFPEEWLRLDNVIRHTIVWAYAKGRAIGTGNAYGQLLGVGPAKPLRIELPPIGDLSFVVVLPNGKPAVGARVEPKHFKTQQTYDWVPRELVDLVAATTDAAGRAAMPALTREGVFTVDVKMTGFGTQQFRCDMKSNDSPEQTLRLRDVGRLEGRIATDKCDLVRGMFVSIETSDPNVGNLRLATGVASVKVDNQGRFVIPEIADGRVEVMARCDERLPVRPRLPERGTLTLLPGETQKFEISLERAVRVHGVVRAKDTQKPLSGVNVSLRYGVGRQGDHAVTNEKGEFSALGLAGEVYVQLISIPNGYVQLGEPWSEGRTVPADAQEFTWPTINVVPSIVVAGKLIDRERKPMANVRIHVLMGNRRYGSGASDENGAFTISRVPKELGLERFEIWTRDKRHTGVIEKQEPLVVRVQN